jgi:CDP-diacylglycerol---serine O-phosphatidyltransferase
MPNRDQAAARAHAQAQLRRGMFLLPSLFTVGNIAAGYYAIMEMIAALAGRGDAHVHLDHAAIAILFAIPFDALDGRIARMTNTTSEFGKELDSLADAITFGVAPSLLAYIWGVHFLPDTFKPTWWPDLRQDLVWVGGFICFVYLIGGVSRLARFNISPDAQPRNPGRPGRKYFVGMPIPAAAWMLASTVHFFGAYPNQAWWVALVWMGLVGACGFLMVSTWRFWSAKEINFGRSHPFQIFLVLAIALFVIVRFSQGVLFTAALLYLFSGLWARAAYSWSWRRRKRLDRASKTAIEPDTDSGRGSDSLPGHLRP